MTTPAEKLTSTPDGLPNHGVEHKHMYSTPSGKRWLGKTENVDAEFDHYVLLKAAGVVTPDIGIRPIGAVECADNYNHGEQEVLIGWLDGATTLFDLTHEASDMGIENNWTKDQYTDALRIAIVDYIMGNPDRHDENLLLWQGRIVAIDGGYCFRDPSESIKQNAGMNPINDLIWDSLTDVFSIIEVMTISNEVVRGIRNALPSLMSDEHHFRVNNTLHEVAAVVLNWYRKTSSPTFSVLS